MNEDLMGCVSTLVEAGLTEEEVGRWLTNRKKHEEKRGVYKIGGPARYLVSGGFSWNDAPEGSAYWVEIYKRLGGQ